MLVVLVLVLLASAVIFIGVRAARRFGWGLAPTEDLRDPVAQWLAQRMPRSRPPHRIVAQVRRQAAGLHLRATDTKTFSPGQITVVLHPDELAAVQTVGAAATTSIASASMKRARAKDWVPRERIPAVTLTADPGVPAGRPSVTGDAWAPTNPGQRLARAPEPPTRLERLPSYVHDGQTQLNPEDRDGVTDVLPDESAPEPDDTQLETPDTVLAQAWLTVTVEVADGPTVSGSCPPEGALTLGRSRSNAVVVEHHLVSRTHATVAWHELGAMVTDAGSSNGIWLDGHRLTDPTVIPADRHLTLGRTGPRVTITHRTGPPR